MNKNKLLKYLVITFIITWPCLLTRAIFCNLNIIKAYSIPGILLYGLAIWGPAISSYLCQDKKNFKNYFKMIFNHKKNTSVYLIGLSIMYTLTFYVSTFKINTDYPLYLVPLIFGVMLFFGGCNEEVGWSGILYQELEKKFSIPIATFITLIIWFIWHLPLFITNGDLHVDLPITTFLLFLITLVLMKTALLKRTGSVFYCGIIHALSNVLETIFLYEVNTIMVIANIILWIVSIILWYYPEDDEENDNKIEEELVKEKEEIITPIINPELSSAIELNQGKEIEELI